MKPIGVRITVFFIIGAIGLFVLFDQPQLLVNMPFSESVDKIIEKTLDATVC